MACLRTKPGQYDNRQRTPSTRMTRLTHHLSLCVLRSTNTNLGLPFPYQRHRNAIAPGDFSNRR